MEKLSGSVKIVASSILLLFIVLDIICLVQLRTAFKVGDKASIIILFILTVFCCAVIGIISSMMLSHFIGRKVASSVYWPGDNVELLPPDYSEIKSHIIKGDYYKAIDKLDNMIEDEPGNGLAVALLTDLYIDHLQKYSESVKILSDYLNRPERTENDIPFVMKLVDTLLEMNEDENAVRLLKRETTLSYNEKDIETLNKRLNGIEGESVSR